MEHLNTDEIQSKVVKAGRRTYFFDVRGTKAGDYYLTITESKKFTNDDGTSFYKKHKIYLYKEDFKEFQSVLNESIDFIFEQKGEEVISEKQEEFKRKEQGSDSSPTTDDKKSDDISFDDI